MRLSVCADKQPDFKEERISVVSREATAISEEASEPGSAERGRTKEQPVPPQPAPEEPLPSEPPPAAEPKAAPTMPPPDEPPPSPAIPRNAVRPSGGPAYGPPDSGGSSSRDSERVGTAPHGEPLSAAAWYREPRDDEMRGYLSHATGERKEAGRGKG